MYKIFLPPLLGCIIHIMCVSLHCWQLNDSVCSCMHVLACVFNSSQQSCSNIVYCSTANHTSLQLNPSSALTAIRRLCVLDCVGESLCDGLVDFTALTFTVYTCTQFLCSILFLAITTFPTKSELLLDQNILLIFYSQIARSLHVFILLWELLRVEH